jgi:hypothetical protein
MGQGLEGRADVEESPSRVPEWQLSVMFVMCCPALSC